MSDEGLGAEYASPSDLAGPYYEEIVASRERALELLEAPDNRVRVAAVLVCESVWKCGPDTRVVRTCRAIAGSTVAESLRICAIDSLGRTMESSRSLEESQFCADLAANRANHPRVRIAAYWALRNIQFGVDDDDLVKQLLYHVKEYLRTHPGMFSEEVVKRKLLGPNQSVSEWDTAEKIDWDIVNRFITTIIK